MVEVIGLPRHNNRNFLHSYDGKCANIHGHRWTIEVTVASEKLRDSGNCRGMLIDFSDLKRAVRTLADEFDHALIYEEGTLKQNTIAALKDENFHLISVPFRPTAENFARSFYDNLISAGLPVKSVTVWETPDNCAVYEEV